MARCRPFFGIALTVAVVAATQACITTVDPHALRCANGNLSPDVRIDACTWLLNRPLGSPPYVDLAGTLNNRGIAWLEKGVYDQALEDLGSALRSKPELYLALNNRGLVWKHKGDYGQAIRDYAAALKLKPDMHEALNNLARVRATARDAGHRDGREAVRLAGRAVRVYDRASTRDTLAAAYAEAGRFTDAVREQEQVIRMLQTEGWAASYVSAAEERLRLYRQGRPYRE